MKILPNAILAMAVFGLFGCGEDEQALLAPAAATPSTVTWSQVHPIMEAHCVRCHASYAAESDARKDAGEIAQLLESREMPVVGAVAPLDNTEWNLLHTWALEAQR